jgi:hypothetical protein
VLAGASRGVTTIDPDDPQSRYYDGDAAAPTAFPAQ